MNTSPSVGSSNPAIILSEVVLPHPEGPSIEKNSPSRICIVTLRTALTISPDGPGKRLDTLRSSTANSAIRPVSKKEVADCSFRAEGGLYKSGAGLATVSAFHLARIIGVCYANNVPLHHTRRRFSR